MEATAISVDDLVSTTEPTKYTAQFRTQNQMIVLDQFLPEDFVVENFLPEVKTVEKYINRVNIPGFKKSGSVSAHILKKHAPQLYNLYQSDTILNFVQKLVDVQLMRCPEDDPHAIALYCYTEPGDRIGFHYDKSFYKGDRYTVLLGLIQDSTHSKLVCYPNGRKKGIHNKPMSVATTPGKLVIFNGNSLWHEVSAIQGNEKRIILTMEFVTDQRMSFVNKLISDFKDRWLYFGKNKTEK